MFGAFQPPQLSAEEIRAGELEAAFTIKLALAGALSLYISPFIIDGISKLL
ncbi:mitochondrial outer membrane translocase complex, subunit Tom5 [Podospora conica]|nr:mitochondrial outer membrane translocase complex, subunit Tom5 [Schizothecium conicum]